MKAWIFTLIFICILISCTSSYKKEKEVYLNLKIGITIPEMKKLWDHNEQLGLFQNTKNRWRYHIHKTSTNASYVSAPIFYLHPGDSLIDILDVFFFPGIGNLDQVMEKAKNGQIQTMPNLQNELSYELIVNEVEKELIKKYGAVTKIDSVLSIEPRHKIWYWKDKRGVDITLDVSRDIFSFYNVRVRYTFNEKMMKAFFGTIIILHPQN